MKKRTSVHFPRRSNQEQYYQKPILKVNIKDGVLIDKLDELGNYEGLIKSNNPRWRQHRGSEEERR